MKSSLLRFRKVKSMPLAPSFHRFSTNFWLMKTLDVAARGLDIPEVDWVIQFDPPDDPRDYVSAVPFISISTVIAEEMMVL